MRCIRGLRDHHHILMTKQPGERYLRRRRAVAPSDACKRAVAQDAALVDGRIRHDRDMARSAPEQKIGLDAPPRKIVEDLVGGDAAAAGKPSELLHVADVEIAHPPSLDQAVARERLKPGKRL